MKLFHHVLIQYAEICVERQFNILYSHTNILCECINWLDRSINVCVNEHSIIDVM